jgi:hypothetical protein
MPVELRSVYSSHVAEIGYDPDANALHVVYKSSGKHAVYRGVPAEVADTVLTAPSIGEALRENIKGVFQFGYE